MNRDNIRSAAGLRRSAIAERLRLREEWSALKGTDNEKDKLILTNLNNKISDRSEKLMQVNEALRGLVVLVDIGSEPRALALRAALSALGANVVPVWSPFVTHLVWSQGGCRSIRAKARVLGCRVVSPLWVEACAAEGRKLSEKIFPAPSRASDLPSPATLRSFLKRAQKENIPLQNLLSDSQDGDIITSTRLRLSSETDPDTTKTTDTSLDTSRDKSKDTSRESPDTDTRVNTAPRRPQTKPLSSSKPSKSKRKLFTQKEIPSTDEEDELEQLSAGPKKRQPFKMTQRLRKDLATAEKMARMIMGTATSKTQTQTSRHTLGTYSKRAPRIVLTNMTDDECKESVKAIIQLNGKIQRHVDKKTTHIVMGSRHINHNKSTTTSGQAPINTNSKMCNKCNSPGKLLSQLFDKMITVDDYSQKSNDKNPNVICSCSTDISGVNVLTNISPVDSLVFPVELRVENSPQIINETQSNEVIQSDNEYAQNIDLNSNPHRVNRKPNKLHTDIQIAETNKALNSIRGGPQSNDVCLVTENRNNDGYFSNVKINKPRTVNALLGAVRGCKVLRYEWVKDSLQENRWLHYMGYEVKHLKKISQKASFERTTLNKMHREYAYNVFNGMRVRISEDAEQKDAITKLLTLCGAEVEGEQENNQIDTQISKTTQKNKASNNNTTKHTRKCEGKTSGRINVKLTPKSHRFDAKTQNGPRTQDGGQSQDGGVATAANVDITVGRGNGEVCSKWVFDSVAAARMRTTRRYINL